MGTKKTLYEILNVSPSASFEQICAEYKYISQKTAAGKSSVRKGT